MIGEWATLSRADRDAAYNNSKSAPGSDAVQQARRDASSAFRAAHPPADIAYGPHERQRIDLFEGGEAGTVVFFHGGYWQWGSRDAVSCLAAGPLAHGFSVAFPGYRLTPEVTLDALVGDVMAAMDRLAERGPLRVAGHSAGGHLAAMALAHSAAASGLAISGVFELGPLRDIYLNDNLRLTDAQVETLSPLRLPATAKPLDIAYGTKELLALVRDSRDLHARRAAAHVPGLLIPVGGADHFTVLDGFQDPAGALCRAVCA